jgi:hypothetical protein
MNEVLFFAGATLVIGLSYYIGFRSGVDRNLKAEVRQFLHDMTVSQMAHTHFMQRAQNETKLLLKHLGVKNPKNIKPVKLMTPEQFDSENKD